MNSNRAGSLIECNPGRLSHFLRSFTKPLLSSQQQREMVDIFLDLTDVCFPEPHPTFQWNSQLSFDGTPLEFSLALSSEEDISLRFLIDTTFFTAEDTRSEPVMKQRAHRVVPHSREAFELIDRLFDRYLEGKRAFSANSVALGARFCPGANRAGRVYFRIPTGSLEVLDRMLGMCADDHTRKSIGGAQLFRDSAFGFCCDFAETGLAGVKVYAFIEQFSQEQVFSTARRFLGGAASRLRELLDAVCSLKESWWIVPQTLVGISRGRPSGLWRVDLHFPLMAWEWTTFASLRAAISTILTRWGYPGIVGPEGKAEAISDWGFAPTVLSIGVTQDGSEDVCAYFKPAKTLHPADIAPLGPAGQSQTGFESRSGKEVQAVSGSAAFVEMYSALLRAEHTKRVPT